MLVQSSLPQFTFGRLVHKLILSRRIFLVMMRFVSDTNISRAEIESVKYISNLILYAQILWHDYASWQKEIDAYSDGKASSLVNAISILMKLHSIDAESAKKLLWDETLEYERRYCEERDLFIKKNSPEPEFYRWFRLLELSTGGNAIWSFTTSRYNKSAPKPVRVQKTNEIAVHGNATDHPAHKSLGGEQRKATDRTMITRNEKPKSVNGVVAQRKVIHVREAEEDDAPKAKRVKVNGLSVDNENHSIVRKDSQRIQGDLFAGLNRDLASIQSAQRNATYLTIVGYTRAIHLHFCAPGKGSSRSTDRCPQQLVSCSRCLGSHYPPCCRSSTQRLSDVSAKFEPNTPLKSSNRYTTTRLDDIQDNSPMRRGFPSTHIVFGLSQTINAATYMYTKGLEVATALSPKTVAALFGK